jgi:hypothetical protein
MMVCKQLLCTLLPVNNWFGAAALADLVELVESYVECKGWRSASPVTSPPLGSCALLGMHPGGAFVRFGER